MGPVGPKVNEVQVVHEVKEVKLDVDLFGKENGHVKIIMRKMMLLIYVVQFMLL